MPIPSNEHQAYNQLTPGQGVAPPQQARRIPPDGRAPMPGPELGNASTFLPCLPRSYVTSKRIAFVAAPYGFGPSSKAIAISSHLPDSIVRDFLGDGPPLGVGASLTRILHLRETGFQCAGRRGGESIGELPSCRLH